jgi:hypothetical protein
LTNHYQPIILIGAARSGTKLLRDLVAAHPQIDKVPYDINYIWRLGNEAVPHDELQPDQLTPTTQQRIQREFTRHRNGGMYLIEKTVSNCLRVPYVTAVFPQAKFIHLVRDGRDVIESVYRQWQAPPDWRYIITKTRSFPIIEAFGYASNYAKNTLIKLVKPGSKAASTWGPRYNGIEEDIASRDLLEVCAIQWVRCVNTASTDLSKLPAEQVLTIHYEAFVGQPVEHLEQIANFLKVDPTPYKARIEMADISPNNIGKGRSRLSSQKMNRIMPLMADTLVALNYTTSGVN